jgi:hypothetical protein
MGNAPYDFVMSHKEEDLARLETFVHRTLMRFWHLHQKP